MISVLIPTYNYNVYPLVRELHKQLDKSGITFEILVYDDASTQIFENNTLLNQIPTVIYKIMPENLGRLALRYRLAQDAKYPNLLFTDADMFPKDRFFISKLIKVMEQQNADIYFGGIQVPDNPPSPQKVLRWKYGKERESLPLEIRKKQPYRSILCGSLLIKKTVFLDQAKKLLPLKKYGLDTYFSFLLKQQKAHVYHYQNPIVHLGLETNQEFLDKTKQAVETYHYLIVNQLLPTNYLKLTAMAHKIDRFIPKMVSRFMYKSLSPLLRKNLLSNRPSLFIFDIYKLLYYLQLK